MSLTSHITRMNVIPREDLSRLLEKAGSSMTVPVLLQALQQSIDFETYVSRKYSVNVRCIRHVSCLSWGNCIVL